MLAIYNLAIAAYMVVIQGIDLHTTSESIKRGVAREDNEVLADQLNTSEPWAVRFWRLAVWKIGAALISAAIGAVAWFMPEYGELAAVCQTLLAIYYTRIMVSNWNIYQTTNQPKG